MKVQIRKPNELGISEDWGEFRNYVLTPHAPCYDNALIDNAPQLYQAVYDLLEIVGNIDEYIGTDPNTLRKIKNATRTLYLASGELLPNEGGAK